VENNKVEKSTISKFFGHLGTVTTHKRHVRRACFKMGLYWQGIFHDFSKFSPSEFIPSVKYYDGTHSPTVEERKDIGYSSCWLHHKGRNKHHYEYWSDYPVVNAGQGLLPVKMPMKYVAEMTADRYAACVAYQGKDYTKESPFKYFERSVPHIRMHKDTIAVLYAVLLKMKDEDEAAAFQYMKELLKITKGSDYSADELGLPYPDL